MANSKRFQIIGTIVLVACTVVACIWGIASKGNPECEIDAFALDQGVMPDGWEKTVGPTSLPGQDALGAQHTYYVFWENGKQTAHYTVYQYSNKFVASFHFWFDDAWFFPSGWKWLELEGAGTLSLRSDQQRIMCGVSDDPYLGDMCVAVLRYGSYIANFGTSIQEGIMGTQDFVKIVHQVDGTFGLCKE